MTTLLPDAAIVTGASRSIGRAIAERLARDGRPVVVGYAHRADEAAVTVRAIAEFGGRAVAVGGDVADGDTAARLFDAADAEFGGAAVLVANAGVSVLGPIATYDDDAYDRVFDASARGTFRCLRAAAARLADHGRVVTVSSTAVATATPGMGVYLAAKAAVETMTRVAAKELAPRGITVNAVAPGLVRSEMFADGKTAEELAAIARSAPRTRLGEITEIADAVSLLTAPDASWISGQVIRVNGGVA
ncbi:SDR family oxidoreductase [Williamsia serinedens]|uniref:3-oxoacyl-[acyl-carrier protein] reductase n=1 Tax=Williamsia serinedens TaxID=391736 RepID=A0ABT1H3F3_9NOCA|nr:SDR family oxidoreductase [Williamsia serinedens]MCP2161103.1 3-oxoacyl-[acyl-carrier protein] reductase [Williamsia serinedens]